MAKPLKISIIGDASKFNKAIDGVSKKLGGFTAGPVAKLGAAIGAAFAGREIINFGRDAVGVASDIEEAMSKVSNVFGANSAQVAEMSASAAKALGISKADYLDYAGSIGAAMTAAGIESGKATELTSRAVQNFSDLASFHNSTAEDVKGSWESAMRGSYEPIQKYMPFINDEFLKTYGATQGLIDENTKKLDVHSRAIILDAIAMDEKLNPAYNDFQETSGGLANQQRILQAQLENVKGELGAKLLPVVTKMAVFLNDNLVPAVEAVVSTLEQWWTKAAPYVSQFIDTVRPKIQAVIDVVRNLIDRFRGGSAEAEATGAKFRTIATRIYEIWKAAFEAAQAVIERVVAIVTAIWEEGGSTIWGQTKDFLGNIFEALEGAFDIIEGLFQLVTAIMTGEWGDAWDAIKQILGGAWTVIKNLVQAGFNALGAVFEVARSALKLLMSKIWGGITDRVTSGISTIVAKVTGWIDGFKSAFSALKSAMLGFGRNIIQGLKDGLVERWESVRRWVSNKVDWIKNKFTSALGIRSPSTVFMGYGKNIVEGLQIGLQSGTRGLESAVGSMIASMEPAPVGGGSSGGIVVNAQTNADPYQIGREVAWVLKTGGR